MMATLSGTGPSLGRHPSPPNTTSASTTTTVLLPADSSSFNFNLNTNNPFRSSASPNLSATSPVRRSPPASASMERPVSRNPFLDPPVGDTTAPKTEHDPATVKLADDIFKEQPTRRAGPVGLPPPRAAPLPNGLPRGPPSPVHRPSRSGDARNGPRPAGRPAPSNGDRPSAHSPSKPRPRRNSESSILDKDKADEERKRRERRREREANGDKSSKSRDPKARPHRRPHGLDVIDKLDVTGIYGQGLFHHDGPFDACNPHRNRKNNQRAPMQAFPANSANNALGGGAPKAFDYDHYHGRGTEAFNDYATPAPEYTTGAPKRDQDRVATLIDTTGRGEQIHGAESHGLGTSTFLEGAPAPRSAIQRYEAENEAPFANGQGLSRKKSLAMRIRGMSQPRRPGDIYNGRVVSPDIYSPGTPPSPPLATQSAGGPLRARPMGQERNPFFVREDQSEKRGAKVEAVEVKGGSAQRAPSSPESPPLTRAITADSAVNRGREGTGNTGLLGRMKSLKGKGRPRPEIKA